MFTYEDAIKHGERFVIENCSSNCATGITSEDDMIFVLETSKSDTKEWMDKTFANNHGVPGLYSVPCQEIEPKSEDNTTTQPTPEQLQEVKPKKEFTILKQLCVWWSFS